MNAKHVHDRTNARKEFSAGSQAVVAEIARILRPASALVDDATAPPLTGALDTRALAVVASSGKLLRSQILCETYRLLGGVDTSVATRLGAIIEVLHAAFLAHDDVIDGDLIRRGKPNVSGSAVEQARRIGIDEANAGRYGAAVGILAGDKLVNAAWAALAESSDVAGWDRLVSVFRAAVDATIDGEHDDVSYALTPEAATLDAALKVAVEKTARYSIALPLQFASIGAGKDDALVADLSDLGDMLGLAYQLDDDMLGMFGDPRLTGKSVTSDLSENKATTLAVLARATPRWAELQPYVGRPLSDAELEIVRRVVTESGVKDAASRIIHETTTRAEEILSSPTFPRALRDYFTRLIPTLVGRAA